MFIPRGGYPFIHGRNDTHHVEICIQPLTDKAWINEDGTSWKRQNDQLLSAHPTVYARLLIKAGVMMRPVKWLGRLRSLRPFKGQKANGKSDCPVSDLQLLGNIGLVRESHASWDVTTVTVDRIPTETVAARLGCQPASFIPVDDDTSLIDEPPTIWRIIGLVTRDRQQ